MATIHRPGALAAATLLAAGLAGCANETGEAHPAAAAEVVAEVGDEPITLDELDAWIKDDLFRRESKDGDRFELYELRSRALERMIEERAVKAEARRRNLSIEELIDQEVTSLGEVTDAEVAAFYDENRSQFGELTLEQMAENIREFLSGRRESKAVAALREAAAPIVHLEPPHIDVAADGPAIGPDGAPVTIIEFSDFQCPFCRRAVPVLEELRERYPDQLRVVYRHLPLERIHSRARPAAEAAMCAEDQQRFWEYHDKLFENSGSLADEDLLRYAEELGLDGEAFASCVGERRHQDKVDADLEAARSAGISGTPAFVINGVLMTGARPVEDFVPVIDAALEQDEGERS